MHVIVKVILYPPCARIFNRSRWIPSMNHGIWFVSTQLIWIKAIGKLYNWANKHYLITFNSQDRFVFINFTRHFSSESFQHKFICLLECLLSHPGILSNIRVIYVSFYLHFTEIGHFSIHKKHPFSDMSPGYWHEPGLLTFL